MSRFWPIPVLKYLLIQRAHRSQNSRFSGFQFLTEHVRCHHRPVAGAVRDGTWLRLSSPEWPALGCVSGVSIPLSSASTPSPSRHYSRCSDKSQSPRRDNSLSTFKNVVITAPLLASFDRGSSVLSQSGRPSRKENRKTLYVLCLVCLISDCFCDC
jgi:hypothetical protein